MIPVTYLTWDIIWVMDKNFPNPFHSTNVCNSFVALCTVLLFYYCTRIHLTSMAFYSRSRKGRRECSKIQVYSSKAEIVPIFTFWLFRCESAILFATDIVLYFRATQTTSDVTTRPPPSWQQNQNFPKMEKTLKKWVLNPNNDQMLYHA